MNMSLERAEALIRLALAKAKQFGADQVHLVAALPPPARRGTSRRPQ